MTNAQAQQRYHIGMVGLSVMGRNLMLNMADHGFSVAGMTRTREVRQRIVVSTNGFPAVIGNVVIDASVLEQLSEVGIMAIG